MVIHYLFTTVYNISLNLKKKKTLMRKWRKNNSRTKILSFQLPIMGDGEMNISTYLYLLRCF